LQLAAREVSQRGGGARRGSVSERGIRLAVEPLWASREPVRWKRRSRTSGSDGWRQGRACVARQRRRNDTAQRPLAVTVTEGAGSPPLENDLALPHLLFPVRRASRPEGYPSKGSSGVSEAPRRRKYSSPSGRGAG